MKYAEPPATPDRSIPFIDTHFHMWELARFPYEWLRSPSLPWLEDLLGDYAALRVDWKPQRMFREFHGQHVLKTVHVEADSGALDPVDETIWVESVANRVGMPNGMVVFADLESESVADTLDRHLVASKRVSGVRIRKLPEDPENAAFRLGLRAVEELNLSFDLNASPSDLRAGRDFAVRNPGIQVILCHAGLPLRRDPEYLEFWKHEIASLAKVDNVACKISALGMGDHAWTVETLRPLVLHCLDSFGVDRIMFGTNWPVDQLFSPYVELVDAWRTIIAEAGFSPGDQELLLWRNAERFYKL